MPDQQTTEAFQDRIRQEMANRGNSVLIVDDEREIRIFVARSIERNCPGIQVVQATNGEDALRKLDKIREETQRDPLLIVTDLNMPIMDGWELVAELEHEYRSAGKKQGIPVIVLSGTSGSKGHIPLMKQSIHGGKCRYEPLVTVAKSDCVMPGRYDAVGMQGIVSWVEYFLRYRI